MIKFSRKFNILDTPNNRSSHTSPTPRGGGVAFIITFTSGLLFYYFNQDLNGDFNQDLNGDYILAICGAGLLVAFIGLLDDKYDLRASLRLVVHLLSALLVLIFVGVPDFFPESSELNNSLVFQIIMSIVIILFLIWMLNLFNFMDGINGIASFEAISVSLVMASLTLLFSVSQWLHLTFTLFSCCLLGFAFFNFPNAKIFMGDAGSGFIGVTLGAFVIISGLEDIRLLWAWLIMLSVFISDATVTLLVRIARGHKPNEAHNLHVYQKLSRKFQSHKPVTFGVLFLNICVLAPIAYSMLALNLNFFVCLSLVYIPLIAFCIANRAGIKETEAR